MKKVKSFFIWLLVLYAKIMRDMPLNPFLGSRFKNKYQTNENHFTIKGQRILITDYIHKKAEQLPEMYYPDGTKANHFVNMKKRFRSGGLKSMVDYIREVNKQIEKLKYPNSIKRFFKNL